MMLKKKNPHFNYIIALYNFDNTREEKTKKNTRFTTLRKMELEYTKA